MRIWDSRSTNSSSKISQDEFIGLRIHPARSRRTNSSGYEFIGLRIHRATKSSSKNPWFSLDEFDGLRIRQATNSSGYEFIKWDLWSSRLTNLTGYELVGLRISRATNEYCENPWVLAGRIGRATNEYCEIPGVLAGRMSTVRSGGFTQGTPVPRQTPAANARHPSAWESLKSTRTLKLLAVRE